MRHWPRPDLPADVAADLDRRQEDVDAGGDVDALWKVARRTRSVMSAESTLRAMTAPRERCMYCEDSHATDIEHFRPKSLYRSHVFRWHNWLWACAGCNRAKGSRFPVDEHGSALLIEPTADDPWEHLTYDSATGEITARWRGDHEDEKGTSTLSVLAPLRNQAVCEGRARTRRGLERVANIFLRQPEDSADEAAVTELLRGVEDHDDYGLAEWFFLREGADEEPFRRLRDERPLAWSRVQARLHARLAGAAWNRSAAASAAAALSAPEPA